MNGLDLKAEAVRAGLALYKVGAEAGINPSQFSRLLNNRVELDSETVARILGAIERQRELNGHLVGSAT